MISFLLCYPTSMFSPTDKEEIYQLLGKFLRKWLETSKCIFHKENLKSLMMSLKLPWFLFFSITIEGNFYHYYVSFRVYSITTQHHIQLPFIPIQAILLTFKIEIVILYYFFKSLITVVCFKVLRVNVLSYITYLTVKSSK